MNDQQRPYVLPRDGSRVPAARTPAVPRATQTPQPPRDDPMAAVMRDRQFLQAEITSLNSQLGEAMGTINGLRAELDAKDRELGRMERQCEDRDVIISRLRSYAMSIRTRLAVFAEMATATHAEAMSESVSRMMGDQEPDAGADEAADAPEPEPAPPAPEARQRYHEAAQAFDAHAPSAAARGFGPVRYPS